MNLDFFKKKIYFIAVIIGVLIIASGVYVFLNLDCFSYKPLKPGPELSAPVFYKATDNGDQYYIDYGNFRIIAIGKDGRCKWTHTNTDACYKELALAPDGRIFVTNYRYKNDSIISDISIDEISSTGKSMGSIYTVSYPVKHLFNKTSQIMDLNFYNNTLRFVTRTDDQLILYSVNPDKNDGLQMEESVSWDDGKEHAIKYCYDYDNKIFYAITALGNIYQIGADDHYVRLLPYPKQDRFDIPFSMTLVENKLVVSDIGSRTVKIYDGQSFKTIAAMKKSDDFFADPALYYLITSAGENEVALTSTYDVYLLNIHTETKYPINMEILFSAKERTRIVLTWICGFFLLVAGMGLLIIFALYYYKKSDVTDFAYNFMMIIIVMVISAIIIANYTMITYDAYQNNSIDKITSIGNLIAKNISAEDVENIDSLEDCNSQSYKNIVNFLNNSTGTSDYATFYAGESGLTEEENIWNENIYIGINKIFDERLYFILATPEETGAIYPLEVAEKEAIDLLQSKNTLVYPEYVSYFGSYCLVQVPIISKDNKVVGTVEVGFNKNNFIKEIKAKQKQIIATIAVVLLLSLLLLKEIIFFTKTLFEKRSQEIHQLINAGSVRTPMFLGQTAYSISIVCGPLFAMQLYSESFGVSKEIAVAISYSATLLFVGIFAFVSGNLVKKVSMNQLIIASTILAIAGELTAANAGGLVALIISRCLFGAGAGMILNSLDTLVAMQPDKEQVEHGFTMSNAGAQGGTIFGVGIGATVMLNFGYRGVYVVSAIILSVLLVSVLLLYNKHNVPAAKDFVEESAGTSFLDFAKNKRVISYTFFLAVPYFLCLGFIVYFLPLAGKAYGLSEQQISYIVIIFGLISIAFGPMLTKKLMSLFNSYIVLIISSVVVAASIIYYGLNQSVFGLVVASLAFAFADSFFQSVQNIYLTQLPESIRYGQGSTLAFSNIVIGIAQMGQSYMFAFAMIFGIKNAFLLIGTGFFVLTAGFLILNIEKKEHKNEHISSL